MDPRILRLVERIHASPKRAVIAPAGAGASALAWLLSVPGASGTVLEAIVPYGRSSMIEFLGHEPAQFVSLETAREMAQCAYRRALHLKDAEEPVVGLASTSSIATNVPKRGDHRCCAAVWDDVGVTSYHLRLAKGQRDRAAEDEVVSRLLLRALAHACNINLKLPLGLLETESLDVRRAAHGHPLRRLLAPAGRGYDRTVRTVMVYPDGRMAAEEPVRAAILSGSFNPIHQGHEKLARVASQMLGTQVVFEMSVLNVDKAPLEESEVRRLLPQFEGRWHVVLTRARTFREKAALFPGCVFVIGWDTAVRLVHPRYYGGREAAMHAALAEIRAAGCRFLVAGRADGDSFKTLADVPVPMEFADLLEEVPESRFRLDISSTALRQAQG